MRNSQGKLCPRSVRALIDRSKGDTEIMRPRTKGLLGSSKFKSHYACWRVFLGKLPKGLVVFLAPRLTMMAWLFPHFGVSSVVGTRWWQSSRA